MSAQRAWTDRPVPDVSPDELVARVMREQPDTFLVVRRSKNSNVMVYQVNRDEHGQVRENEPVVGYWLLVEPSYRHERRHRGVAHDREEMTFVERNLAYGFASRIIRRADQQTELSFTFSQLANLPLTVLVQAAGAKLFGRTPRTSEQPETPVLVRSLFVHGTDLLSLVTLSSNIRTIDVQAVRLTDRQPVLLHVNARGRISWAP